jgi:hypothetical protein
MVAWARVVRIVLLCLALLTLPAQAREWTDEELRWGAALAVTRIIDWGQTRYIAKHPGEFREANPFLPHHPSMSDVNRHFIVGNLLMFGAAHYLPQYRSTLLKVWVAIGVGANAHNAAIGVRISF